MDAPIIAAEAAPAGTGTGMETAALSGPEAAVGMGATPGTETEMMEVDVGQVDYLAGEKPLKACDGASKGDCEAQEGCMWNSVEDKCYLPHKSIAEVPEWVTKYRRPSREQLEALMQETRSMSQFHAIVGEHPNPENFYRAYLWQRTYEQAADPTVRAYQASQWAAQDLLRYTLQKELELVRDPAVWVQQNKFEFKSKVPNPDWNGTDAATQFLEEPRTAYPGDIIWGGADTGLIGDPHMEVFYGMRGGEPWGIGLGMQNDPLEYAGAEGKPEKKRVYTGIVRAGNLWYNFRFYGDGFTRDLWDVYPESTRLPRLQTVKLAVSSVGLWGYKMTPKLDTGNPISLYKTFMDPDKYSKNCQQFASYVQTGNWFSPVINQGKMRIYGALYNYMQKYIAAKMNRELAAPTKDDIYMEVSTLHGRPEKYKEEQQTHATETAAREAILSRTKYNWPVADKNAMGCEIHKASMACFAKAMENRKSTLAGLLMTQTIMKKSQDRLAAIRSGEALSEVKSSLRKARGHLAALTRQRPGNPEDRRKKKEDAEETRARIEAMVATEEGLPMEEEALEAQIKDSQRLLSGYTTPDSVEKDYELLASVIEGRGKPEDLPPHIMYGMTSKWDNVEIKCGDVTTCRNIHEYRRSLARQTTLHPYDPASGEKLSAANIEMLMRAPPPIRDQRLKDLDPKNKIFGRFTSFRR